MGNFFIKSMPCCVGREKFRLPPDNSIAGVQGQGWQLETEVGPSLVPESGNGRFAKADIAKGSQVIVKKGVEMTNITEDGGLQPLSSLGMDAMIMFTSRDEIDQYVKLSEAEGHTKEQVLETIMHFVHGFDTKYALLNVSAYTVNHQDTVDKGLNVEISYQEVTKEGIKEYSWVGIAKKDIKAGDELMIDYRRFKIPQFYKDFCKDNGFQDVRTAVIEAVYGKDSKQ